MTAEISNIDRFGLWILIRDREYFLPYDRFPWLRRATIEDILHVELLHGDHLHWPALDVDLCIDSLADPNRFPLIYRQECLPNNSNAPGDPWVSTGTP